MSAANPYQTPDAAGELQGQKSEDLARLARVHRRVNLIVLANIFAVFSLFGVGALVYSNPDLANVLSTLVTVFLVVSWIALAVSLFQLARALGWSMVLCVLAVLSMFIGLVNLIVIVAAISSANTKLKKAGYRVGLLGVSPRDL